MRMRDSFEAYLDGFNTVNVYINKNYYGGKSKIFHLKDSKDAILPLTIANKNDIGQYTHYELALDSPLIVGEEYMIFDEHCQSVPVEYSHITKVKEFADQFTADEDVSLGIDYSPASTTFTLWSPVAHSIDVVIHDPKGDRHYLMIRQDKGVWQTEIKENLLHARYTYLVRVNGRYREINDPYTPFSGANGAYSQVEDLSLLKMPRKVALPPLESETDAIIYEASIRDMTSQTGTGVLHPKTFEGFVEENNLTRNRNTGFSYIKNLGVTHIQLMPVLDFGSVDEKYPNIFYNWGYDPMHYRAPEGSYSSNPDDGAARVVELAELVAAVHKAGMRVNLDVVFNHVYNRDRFNLEGLVPNYYFLMNSNGDFSNGSFCGNDIDSRPAMSRRYLVDTCKMLVEIFDVDGFRFDLMGVLDYETINEIAKECRKIKPGFMIYGEGWNMPSFVPDYLRASQNNQAKMPNVGQFSDRFREVVRGSNGELERKGFSSGNTGLIEDARQVIVGSVLENRFDTPKKAVNYVECHDNHTLWDKNRKACLNETREMREKRQILANAMVLMAQGVPFLHAGQEFGRTKINLGNTYNRSDTYNRIDYFRAGRHKAIVDATIALIRIRKEHPVLRLDTVDKIRNQTSTETISDQVLVYKVHDDTERLILFFNPTGSYYEYIIDNEGEVLFDSGDSNVHHTRRVIIAPISAVVVKY